MYRTTVAERVELGLIFDHSDWAKSVVWSCGRPGFVPPGALFDHTAMDRSTARIWWQIAAGIVPVEHTFKVTAV
jgi:hypothetical protein